MDSPAIFSDYDRVIRAKANGRPKSESDGIAWGQPIDFLTDPNAREIKLEAGHVPPPLYPFVMDAAARMGVDPATVALTAIVSCASIASDTWAVQPKRHDTSWTENPRLWGAIVGDPSIRKSPVLAICTKPIDALDKAARQKHADEMRAYKQAMQAFKKDKATETDEPRHPRLARYMVEGTTIEALTEVLRDDDEAKQEAPAGKVLCRHDEMSEFFASLDRYSGGGRGGGDRGAYLRLYNGGRYTVDRIGRGSFAVPNWSACFLGGIQPGPIQTIAKGAAEDGLLQRLIYVVPGDQKPGEDRPPCERSQSRYNAIFPALAALFPRRTRFGEPMAVVFHADAHKHRENVDAMAYGLAMLPDTSPRLKSAFGKWPGMFARLALTFHLIEVADDRAQHRTGPSEDIISPETASRAAGFMLDIVLPHLMRADAVMFSTAQSNHAERVAGFIIINGQSRITSRDIMRNYRAFASPEASKDMAAVMDQLTLVNWLEPETPSSPFKPVHAWTVNPAVFGMFPQYAEREKKRRADARAGIALAAETRKTLK